MKLLGKVLSGFSLMIITGFSQASVIYDFSFSNLSTDSNFEDGTVLYFDDFNITLTYDSYVTTSGLNPLDNPNQPTSLGYEINFAGAHPTLPWAFDDDGAAEINEQGVITYNGTSFWLFFFYPEILKDYIKAPGTHLGIALGNALVLHNEQYRLIGFSGFVSLNVTETAVPEPSSLLLILCGILGLFAARRAAK